MDDRLLTIPCQVYTVTAGALDEYGDATITTSFVTTVCHIEPLQASETGGEVVEETLWRIWLLPSVSLDGLDSVTITGQRYSLTGDPATWINPRTGILEYQELKARRVR